ncbi:MAG: DUF3012 domain-containing protein [Alphaproteobacteria bacterium]
MTYEGELGSKEWSENIRIKSKGDVTAKESASYARQFVSS